MIIYCKITQNLNANALLASGVVKLEIPRGMRDIEPEEFADIGYVRDKFFETAKMFRFKLMEPSPLEMLATLEAKSGASIANEIYAFKDKGERNVALRFDLTIGLTRYVTSRRDLKMPAKLATFAGVWRYDEPQAGRYRYFHQWDIEVYGPFVRESDAEIIEFVSAFFENLNLKVSIEVNDRQLIEQYIKTKLGISNDGTMFEMFRAVDKVAKKGAQAVLQEYKGKIEIEKLQALIELSKVKGTIEAVARKADVKGLESWQNFVDLMDSLKARKVENVLVNLGIVRGLDYYSGIVFEVFDPSADGGALVGGGRYDKLTEAFGRKDIGATGAAGGIERIVMALRRNEILKVEQPQPLIFVSYATEDRHIALQIVSTLRSKGFNVDYDILGRNLRKQLEEASVKGAKFTIVVAPEETKLKKVIVRNMKNGKEEPISTANVPEKLSEMLRA